MGRLDDQNLRLYVGATKKELNKKSKKHKCIIVYDSSSNMLVMSTGTLSAGGEIHRQMCLKHDANLCWYAFGGYLNDCANGQQLERVLEIADIFYVDFRERPENEPARGEGSKALAHHVKRALRENPKLKIFVKTGSRFKIPGAIKINSIEDITEL
ncbi:MAG: hypothetical protein ACM3PZ_01990 [Bacillota bacterium]